MTEAEALRHLHALMAAVEELEDPVLLLMARQALAELHVGLRRRQKEESRAHLRLAGEG